MRKSIPISMVLFLVSWALPALAEEVSVETALTGLRYPGSVAIRPGGTPERYEVFVAEIESRRIIKTWSNEPSRSTSAITDIPAASAPGNRGPGSNPFCLFFLDERHLVVAISGAPPELRLYELTDDDSPRTADAPKQKVRPEMWGGETENEFAACVGLARTRSNDYVPDMLLVAFGASSHVSTVWKVPVRANMLGDMRPLESKPESHGLRPNALIVSEQGHVLAVDDASGSIKNRLTFLNPTTGQVVLRIQMELTGIRGVAYSPKSGNLYALAAAQSKDEQGLFRLDDASESGKREIAVTKIVEIRRPAALAFGQDGALYVTTIDEDTEEGGGKLLKVTGGL